MLENIINILDIIASIVLILLIIFFAKFYKNYKIEDNKEYKYFLLGLLTKIIGAVSLAFVYVFFYGWGDTLEYFQGANNLNNVLFTRPNDFFQLLLSDKNNIPSSLNNLVYHITYYKNNESWFMIKITSIINLLSFNRYLISSIFFSLIAFWGGWKLFKTFLFFSPKYHKASFISIFLLPSIIFWSSGVLKDTITFAMLGIFFHYTTKLIFKKKFSITSLLLVILSSYIIFKLKAYIILGFLPAIFIGYYVYSKNKIKNALIRKLSAPLLLFFALIIGYLLINTITSQSDKYKISGLEKRVEGFHSWHTTRGGSSYNLGKIDYSTIGIFKKIPESLNVTFFRPYLWEIRSVTTIANALESLVVFLLFIYVLIKYKLRFFTISFKNVFLIICVIYSIIFGFAVGFTSYNFGALARYKVPVMPFFVFLLLYFYYNNKFKIDEQPQK